MGAEDSDGSIPVQLRRERMREAIQASEFVRVAQLSAMFGISEVTVRSDLERLAERGLVRRVRGGAIPPSTLSRIERTYEESLGANPEEKARIGEAAAAMVSDGQAVVLDVGTTTAAVARALTARVRRGELEGLDILTNGLTIALELEPTIPKCMVVVTGGTLRPLQHSLVDPLAGLVLDQINADMVFLGCNGVHERRGVSNINLPEATVKRSMLRAASRRVVVADGSKVGGIDTAHLCGLDEIDVLITGESANPDSVAALRERGLEIDVVKSGRYD